MDNLHCTENYSCFNRADPRFAPSQWVTSLQSDAVSHWLGTKLESALFSNACPDFNSYLLVTFPSVLSFAFSPPWSFCQRNIEIDLVEHLKTSYPGPTFLRPVLKADDVQMVDIGYSVVSVDVCETSAIANMTGYVIMVRFVRPHSPPSLTVGQRKKVTAVTFFRCPIVSVLVVTLGRSDFVIQA